MNAINFDSLPLEETEEECAMSLKKQPRVQPRVTLNGGEVKSLGVRIRQFIKGSGWNAEVTVNFKHELSTNSDASFTLNLLTLSDTSLTQLVTYDCSASTREKLLKDISSAETTVRVRKQTSEQIESEANKLRRKAETLAVFNIAAVRHLRTAN